MIWSYYVVERKNISYYNFNTIGRLVYSLPFLNTNECRDILLAEKIARYTKKKIFLQDIVKDNTNRNLFSNKTRGCLQ